MLGLFEPNVEAKLTARCNGNDIGTIACLECQTKLVTSHHLLADLSIRDIDFEFVLGGHLNEKGEDFSSAIVIVLDMRLTV